MALTEKKPEPVVEHEEEINYRFVPRYTTWTEEGKLFIEVALPGVKRDKITIRALEDFISIRAKRGDTEYVLEKYLPFKVYPEKSKVEYFEGLLKIEMIEHSPWDDAIELKIE